MTRQNYEGQTVPVPRVGQPRYGGTGALGVSSERGLSRS